MHDYELTVITRDEATAAVEQAIDSAGGRVTDRRTLGRKTFAYPINKETAGFYTTFRLQLEPTSIADLNRKFLLMDGLLRHLVVQLPIEKLSSDLDIDELQEAKDVKEKEETSKTSDAERGKLLDEQLSKLIGGDEGDSKESASTNKE